MKRLLYVFLVLVPIVGLAAVNVIVEWDANTEAHAAGYRVLIGSATRVYTRTNSVAGRLTTSATMAPADLPPGVVYIAVVAYGDDPGLESLWSREVVYTNRLLTPVNIKVRTTITIEGSP